MKQLIEMFLSKRGVWFALFSLILMGSMQGTEEVDILIVYTTGVSDYNNGEDGVRALANLAVQSANEGLASSAVDMRLNLVGLYETNYIESEEDTEIDLDNLTDGVGDLSNVAEIRDQVGADLVCLFRNGSVDNSAGIAWILNLQLGRPTRGFSVVSAQAAVSGFAFLHELGHNLGAAHDRENANSDGLYPFSYGHRFNANGAATYRTVMSYAPGWQLNRFSNPDVMYSNVATGVAEGEENAADNAKTLAQTGSIVAGYRAHKKVIAEAGSNIVFADEYNDGVETVTLDGSRSRGDEPIVSWIWTWSGGSTRGEIENVQLPLGETEVTLTVEDGLGERSTIEFDVEVRPLKRVVDLETNFVVEEGGALWAMGNNHKGQLGTGTQNYVREYEQVIDSGVESVSAGWEFTLVKMVDGSLWSTGSDRLGELGDGNGVGGSRSTFMKVVDSGVASISAGYGISLFVKTDGSLWGMGRNEFGELGDGTNNHHDIPVEIVTSGVERAYAGGGGSLILMADRSLLRIGKVGGYSSEVPEVLVASGVLDCSVGVDSFLVVKDDGSLWGIGENFQGQLGDGTRNWVNELKQIVPSGVRRVFSSQFTTFFLKDDGSLWAMGKNENGQLGAGVDKDVFVPMQIASGRVVDVVPGEIFTILVKDDGSLWGMGWDLLGLIGDGPDFDKVFPLSKMRGAIERNSNEAPVIVLATEKFEDFDYSGSRMVTLDARPSVDDWMIADWEWSWSGGHGTGESYTADFPLGETLVTLTATDDEGITSTKTIVVTVFQSSGGVESMAASRDFSLIVKASGTLLSSGENSSGQLGDGTTVDRVALGVVFDGGVRSVSAGWRHSLVVLDSGALFGFGDNGSNELGIDRFSDTVEPQSIVPQDVRLASCGREFSVFLKNDDTLWGMGSNTNSELGQRETIGRTVSTPTQIDTDVRQVAAGWYHLLILKNDGSLWGQGQGTYGQIGPDASSRQGTPVMIEPSGVVGIAGGDRHSLYIKDDGSLWGMGQNSDGEIGERGFGYVLDPILIEESGVIQVAAGESRTLYVKDDGSLWGMGSAHSGHLGLPFHLNDKRQILAFDVDSVAASDSHTLIKMKDGSLRLLGKNHFKDTSPEERVAVEVVSLSDSTPTLRKWLLDYYSIEEIDAFQAGLYLSDPDGDGLSNGSEYILGTDPTDVHSVMRVEMTMQNGKGVLKIHPYNPDVEYGLQVSEDMKTWSTSTMLSTEVVSDAFHGVVQLDPKAFYRVTVAPR